VRHVLLHLLFCGLIFAQPKMLAFGKEVESEDTGMVLMVISDGYAAKYGLTPTKEELAPLRKKFPPIEGASRVLDFPFRIVQSWKLNKVWWDKHGGRLALSSFGVHLATDAMLKEVEAMEKAGDVKFLDPKLREKFFTFFKQYGGDGLVQADKAKRIFEQGLPK
jgi:hypothetical protein